MKKLSFLLILFLANYSLFAQDTLVYEVVEKGAVPEKGYPEFYDFLRKNLKMSSIQKRRMGLGCHKYYFEGIVTEQGIFQLQKVKPDSCLALESIKSALETIKWIPAEHKGKKVKQRIIIPIQIKLG